MVPKKRYRDTLIVNNVNNRRKRFHVDAWTELHGCVVKNFRFHRKRNKSLRRRPFSDRFTCTQKRYEALPINL